MAILKNHNNGNNLSFIRGQLTLKKVDQRMYFETRREPWTPSLLEHFGWWDPSNVESVSVGTDNRVTEILDLSGNNKNLQAPSGRGPAYGSRQIGWQNVLDFNSVDDAQSNFLQNQDMILNQAYSFTTILSFDDETPGSDDNDVQDVIFDTSGGARNLLRRHGDGTLGLSCGASIATTDSYPEGNDLVLLSVIKNGANSSIRVNGIEVASGNAGSTNGILFRIGSNYNGSQGTDSAMTEVILSKSILEDDIEKLEGYLAWKWRSELLLDETHIYANQRPEI